MTANPPSKGQKAGFSFMELLVVIGVIAILAMASYPLLRGSRAEAKIRSASTKLTSLCQKARVMAINQQRPFRVVINCAKPGGFESCYMDLQSAVYVDAAITGWLQHTTDHEIFDKSVLVSKTDPAAIFDGAVTIPNIYWVIFMPAGQAYSDPRAFEIFLYGDGQMDPLKKGWRLSVDNVSGRVKSSQDAFTPLT